jgi:ADP-heptose:LPS heptosyltransferase
MSGGFVAGGPGRGPVTVARDALHPVLRQEPIRQVAIFRALVLGDLLCAVPAWRALHAAWPEAEFTLIGLPWARELVKRLDLFDRFIEFPGYPGLPEVVPDLDALPEFLQQVQAERFDLLLQMHGSGSIVNPLLATFGARHVAGFCEPGSEAGRCGMEDELFTPWPDSGHEIERMLALSDHLGAPRQGLQLEFPVTDADRIELASVFPEAFGGRAYVCVHPGAQLPSRRWSTARFAEAADWLADQGYTVVLTGTPGERALADQLQQAMRRSAVNLVGVTTLWTLGALVERASLVLCNDTGISHVAAALQTPSVVISSGADVSRWAPLDADLHRVLWRDLACRPCGFATCPYDHACAEAVTAERVIAELESLLYDEHAADRIEVIDMPVMEERVVGAL